MKINVVELERAYKTMTEEKFESVDWLDLTEEARPIYEKELSRRNPVQWQEVIAERKESLRISALNKPTESVLSPRGRLSRQDYAIRVMSVNAGVIALSLLFRAAVSMGGNLSSEGVTGTGVDTPHFVIFAAILLSFGFAGFALVLVQAIKRLHDLNRPGSQVLLLLVPLYGLYLSFLLLFTKGATGANLYGNDPQAERTVSLRANLHHQAVQH